MYAYHISIVAVGECVIRLYEIYAYSNKMT